MNPSLGVFCLVFSLFVVVYSDEGKCANPNNLPSLETRAIPGGRTTCTIPGTTDYAKASASITIQADVDYLHLDECNIVDGSLRFDGFRSDLDLSQFESIEHITGQLVLTRLRVSKIEGFHNLKSVKKLSISDNANLTDLTVFRSLTNISELTIENNPNLRSLDGLQGITSLRFLSLVNNKNLVDISALKDVQDFYNIQLIGNTNLRALHALEGINSTVATLVILDNHGLTDLVGLGKVQKISSNLRIENNQNLKSLRGLKVKDLETASVYVTNNPKLEDISQFSFVEHEAKEIAVISNNPALNCHRFSQLKFFPVKTSSNNLVDCPFVKTEAQKLRELNEQKVAEGPGDEDEGGEDTGNFLDDLLKQIPQE